MEVTYRPSISNSTEVEYPEGYTLRLSTLMTTRAHASYLSFLLHQYILRLEQCNSTFYIEVQTALYVKLYIVCGTLYVE